MSPPDDIEAPPYYLTGLLAKYTPSPAERRVQALGRALSTYDEAVAAIRAPKPLERPGDRSEAQPSKSPGRQDHPSADQAPITDSSGWSFQRMPQHEWVRAVVEDRQQREKTEDPTARIRDDQDRLSRQVLEQAPDDSYLWEYERLRRGNKPVTPPPKQAWGGFPDYFVEWQKGPPRGNRADVLPDTAACEGCGVLRPTFRIEEEWPCPECRWTKPYVDKVELSPGTTSYDPRYAFVAPDEPGKPEPPASLDGARADSAAREARDRHAGVVGRQREREAAADERAARRRAKARDRMRRLRERRRVLGA